MDPFIGEIKIFAGNYAPLGWNFCDGTLLPISNNDALFNLIGTTYGGDGQTTFGVPDMRGRVPIHQGTGTNGAGSYTIGQAGGAESVTLTVAQIPSHTHQLSASADKGTATDPTNNVIAQTMETCKVFAPTTSDTTYNAAHIAAGGGTSMPHENRQPYVAINYIIALQGIYPPQS